MLCFGLRIELIRWKKRIFNEAFYDRLLNAVIAVVISLAIAMRDHFGIK